MADLDLPRLVFLVILGAAVTGWFIAEHRDGLGKGVRMAIAWGLIFLGVIAGYGLWGDMGRSLVPRQAVVDGRAIEVPRGPDGHFHLVLEVNDTPVRFVVDTGASDIVLSERDTRRVGIDPDQLVFTGVARTANGTVRTAFTRVDEISLGPIRVENVGVSVNGGEMDSSLLGMAFLDRFSRIEIAGNRLRLEP